MTEEKRGRGWEVAKRKRRKKRGATFNTRDVLSWTQTDLAQSALLLN